MDIDALFRPSNVAVIGASQRPGKIGHTVLKNLVDSGFPGIIHPVHPTATKILGITAVQTIADLPSPVDLAVIAIPREGVVQALKALVERRLRSAVVVTSGFKEAGREGLLFEEEIARIGLDNDVALVGPDSLGVMSVLAGLNASCTSGLPAKGNVAFFSQSGILCSAILDWAKAAGFGFSSFVSLGNKSVLDESHLLYYLAQDPQTKVILGYIENVNHGEAFLRMARKATREKPVIVLKAGSTPAGAKAASSQAGSLVGSDKTYEAAFRQTGILRASSIPWMFDLAQGFSLQPLPKGPRLAVVTNAGGPAILAADATEDSILGMVRPSEETLTALAKILPAHASLYNPIDILTDADPERLGKTMAAVVRDPEVDSLLAVITPTRAMDGLLAAQALIQAVKGASKPVFCCFMGGQSVAEASALVRREGIPCYPFPDTAVKCLEAMYRYHAFKSRPSPVMASVEGRKDVVRRVIKEVRAQGLTEIVDDQAQAILQAYDIPAAPTVLARSSDEAVAAAEQTGYPVVCKVSSPQVAYKADAGGVIVGIETPEELRQAFMEITGRIRLTRPDVHVNGCLVQAMAPQNVKEVILGFKRDDDFGPLLMFGLSGIYVDVLKDVSYRLAPLSMNDARQLVREIRSFMLLRGVRGEQAVNVEAIEDMAIRLSQLAIDFPDIFEAELNPVSVNHAGAIVADARLMLLPH